MVKGDNYNTSDLIAVKKFKIDKETLSEHIESFIRKHLPNKDIVYHGLSVDYEEGGLKQFEFLALNDLDPAKDVLRTQEIIDFLIEQNDTARAIELHSMPIS